MQRCFRAILFAGLVLYLSCQGKEQKNIPGEISIKKPVEFFPVTDFILGQLGEIDNLPITPLKINIDGEKKDSAWMKREDIRRVAFPFLSPVIDSLSMVKYFNGKSFLDQSINAFTFSYDAKAKLPDSIKLIHWDVYIDPHKNNVQRIYMVKEDSLNSNLITTQLTWKANQWLSIRTIVQSAGKAPLIKENIVKWDFNE
ncbi:MAG: hypothetical protein ABIO81_04790 [Ginsengibacter sp.]